MVFYYTGVTFVMLRVFIMGWPLPHLPTDYVCGASFTVDHAYNYTFTCSHGGYPTLLHNEIRGITAQLISEVCPNVATEPTLQPVSNERFFTARQILRVLVVLASRFLVCSSSTA